MSEIIDVLVPDAAPALIEHRKSDIRPNQFVPDTRLVITPALRTSGLLAALSDREVRTLLALLTLYTPNGQFTGTAPAIALALGLQGWEAQKGIGERLRALTVLSFRGAPLVIEVPRDQAQAVYVPGPHLVRHIQEETVAASPDQMPLTAVSREIVVALNREKHTRSREEAERNVQAQLGHDPRESEDTPDGDVLRRLLSAGITREEAQRLLSGFPLEQIQRQLDWLPYREARSPARFLVAAIEKQYDPPAPARETGDAEVGIKP